jgi:long-chain acyl-CoA synthetase
MTDKKKNFEFKIPSEIDFPKYSLIDFFREIVDKNRHNNAIFFKGKIKNYEEVEEEVNKFANSLKKIGLKKGDRIAVFLPNCPQFITIFFAAQSIGAIFIAFNPLYSSRELNHRINDCKPKVLITLDIFINKIINLDSKNSIENIIISSISDELPSIKKILYKLITIGKDKSLTNSLSYKELLEGGKNEKIYTKIDPKNDIALLQYTGGTTGDPKGAMLTHSNLISQSFVLKYWKNGLRKLPDEQFKVAGILPYSHIFGLASSFLWPISEAATIFLVPDPRKLVEIMGLIQKHKIHFLYCVPVFFQKFASHKSISDYDMSSLHLCVSGGEGLPSDTVKLFEEKINCLLIEGYGLSEASPVTHINPPNINDRKTGSIGVIIPNTQAKIIDTETGKNLLKKDEAGELWVKGPGIMKGYWRNKKATDETIIDGWLRTGDVVTVDKDGFFKVIDRLKDVIIVSGFKVWPNEVEEVLMSHPSIKEAAVIPNTIKTGINLKAFLVKKIGESELSLEEVRRFCKNLLAPYKIPKIIEYRQELPRSPVGKLLRRELRDEDK